MKKSAFSLIELVISIFLLGLIVTFLYTAVGNLQISNKIFEEKEAESNKREKLIKALYDDLFHASSVEISGSEMSKVDIITTNSFYNIQSPNVVWLVSKQNNSLLRLESSKPLKTYTFEERYATHISKVGEKCEIFQVYQSNNKDKFLLHIQFENEKPVIYEFYKPMQYEKEQFDMNQTTTQP